jgi:hypothetical protein
MIILANDIYTAKDLHKITSKVKEWNFETLNGIGFYRGHDKYSLIELKIYEFKNYTNKNTTEKSPYSSIEWNIPENQFSKSDFELGKSDLIKNAEFIVNWISSIKGERLNLIFEINFTGYSPTDAWHRGACGRAFINAIISCFDETLYFEGSAKKNKNHFKNREYQSEYC